MTSERAGLNAVMKTGLQLPEPLVTLLREPSLCYVSTLMPDGSPQLTQVWADTDGEHVLINTVRGFRKVKNVERDPRIAVTIADSTEPSRYYSVRGRVVGITEDGGAEHIEKLAQRYLGRSYPWFGGRDQVRLILTIEADAITTMG
jgi:PPOX class probable F420-dependent enzyme